MSSTTLSAGSSASSRLPQVEGLSGQAAAVCGPADCAEAYQEALQQRLTASGELQPPPQAQQPPPPQVPPPSLLALRAQQAAAPAPETAAPVPQPQPPQALQSPPTTTRGVEEAVAAAAATAAAAGERRRSSDGQPQPPQQLGSRGSVRVMARVRPLLSGEEDGEGCLRVLSQTQLEVLTEPRALLADHRSRRRTTGGITQSTWRSLEALPGSLSPRSSISSDASAVSNGRGSMEARTFSFDTVFGTSMSDDDVFGAVQQELATALNGEAVCILAYGATGSGKTHTVMNLAERTAQELERQASSLEQAGLRLEIMVQIVEIYNDQLRDLLAQDANHEPPRLKLSVQANTPMLQGATLRSITGGATPGIAHSLQETLSTGQAQRTTSATAVHARSSRSHLVMKLFLCTRDAMTGSYLRTGKLSLVDLAGSERLKRSEVQGERLKEAQHINKSLSALADVVSAKDRRMSHVPYRNSKLTHMLQDTLGDQCRTVIIVALPPTRSNLDETLHSLHFSARLNCITLEPPRMEAPTKLWMQEPHLRPLQEDAEAERLQAENARLRTDLDRMRSQLEDREVRLQEQERRLLDCERRLEEREKDFAAQHELLLEFASHGLFQGCAGRSQPAAAEDGGAVVWPLPGASAGHVTPAWASTDVPPLPGSAEASSRPSRTPSLSDLGSSTKLSLQPAPQADLGQSCSAGQVSAAAAAAAPPAQTQRAERQAPLSGEQATSVSSCSSATPNWGERSLRETCGAISQEAGAAAALAAAVAGGGEKLRGEAPTQRAPAKTATGPDSAAGGGSARGAGHLPKEHTQVLRTRQVPTPARARGPSQVTRSGRSGTTGADALISPPGRYGTGAAAARAREAPSSARRVPLETKGCPEPAVASAPTLAQPAVAVAAASGKAAGQFEAKTRARPEQQEDSEAGRSRSASSRGLRSTPRKYVVEVITPQHAEQLTHEGLRAAAQEAVAEAQQRELGSPPRSPTLLLCPGEEDSSFDDSSPRSSSSDISLSSNEVDIQHRLVRDLRIEAPQELPSPLSSTVTHLPENGWNCSGILSVGPGSSHTSASGIAGATPQEARAASLGLGSSLRPVPALPSFSGEQRREAWANPTAVPSAGTSSGGAAVHGRGPCADHLMASGKAHSATSRPSTKPSSPRGIVQAPWSGQPAPQPTPRQRAAGAAATGGSQPQQRSPPRAQHPPATSRAPSFSWSPRGRYGRPEPSTAGSRTGTQRGTHSAVGCAPPQTPRREKYMHLVSQVGLGQAGARR
uniref:Kinesin motor domain-containing protein n=1 Tax=Alexandrium monilatum TaxID=311494 RepID=A0A7S4QHZ9_9DINO